MGTINHTALTDLISAGADAMNNLFDVTITPNSGSWNPGHVGNQETAQALSIRCDGFTPPSESIPTYSVTYKNVSFDRPASTATVSRTFSINFRIDANYNVYKALQAMHARTFVGARGFTNIELDPRKLLTIKVRALDTPTTDVEELRTAADGTSTESLRYETTGTYWVFKDCWISTISAPSYSNGGSGSAISTSVTFYFGDYDSPQTSYLGL